MNNPTSNLPGFARGAINLASARLGAKAIHASDEFFAAKERMLEDAPPVFVPDRYDDHGKWMDGWETRRKRGPGHDFCIVRLALPGRIAGVDIDTSHFTGNYPPAASLDACRADGDPDAATAWTEVLAPSPLGASAHHFFPVADGGPFTHVRLNIHPDGGVARLRVFGEPVADWEHMDRSAVHELSALANGGRIVAYNDAHYGSVWTLLAAGRGLDMGDGWETRRRREPGHDWIIVKLGAPGTIERVEVDTGHYKGNYPDACSLQGAMADAGTEAALVAQALYWEEILPARKLGPDAIHTFGPEAIRAIGPVSHVKLNIHPDGGVSRLRIFGRLA